MADAPWQCPQCGTVNEPSASACRGCGRWPSLFDLERGAIATTRDEPETWASRPLEVDELYPEISFEPELEVEPVTVEPTSVEPVNVTFQGTGCSYSIVPVFESPVTILTTPGGR